MVVCDACIGEEVEDPSLAEVRLGVSTLASFTNGTDGQRKEDVALLGNLEAEGGFDLCLRHYRRLAKSPKLFYSAVAAALGSEPA